MLKVSKKRTCEKCWSRAKQRLFSTRPLIISVVDSTAELTVSRMMMKMRMTMNHIIYFNLSFFTWIPCTHWFMLYSDLDPCSTSPCLHGGTCNSTGGIYTCSCPAGFHGVNCEQGKTLTVFPLFCLRYCIHINYKMLSLISLHDFKA